MPLMKYFIFVGSALVGLLLTINWLLPEIKRRPCLQQRPPETRHQDRLNGETT